MLVDMLRLFLAAPVAVVLLTPARADANSCQLHQPAVDVYEVPIGCPAVILSAQGFGAVLDDEIEANATRGSQIVEVTGAVERSTTTREVDMYTYESPEACELMLHREQMPFDVVSVELVGVEAGDVVAITDGTGKGASLTIVAAAPCPPSDVQTFSCAEPIQFCDEDGDDVPDHLDDDVDEDADDGGCAAGGGAAPGAALALLGLLRRRRR